MYTIHKRKNTALKFAVIFCWAAGVGALAIQGCQSSPDAIPAGGSETSVRPKVLGIFPPPPERSGAELWADNCTRCHNAPPPERFSDAQWEIIVHHMRLRADLTGEESRKITEFLKASN